MNTEEAKAIGKEAYVYLYPIVKNYLSIYQFGIDAKGSQYKGPINQVNNVARVFTPDDTGVITPNSDTPYSFLVLDLRAEPILVSLPAVEPGRYYSFQLVDLYTNNVDYLGTRIDGNGGGDFLIAGPGWKGTAPRGFNRVIRLETELAYCQVRTQLFDPADIDKVAAIQSEYAARPLSACPGQPAAEPAAGIDWPVISEESFEERFWDYANFLLPFCPPLATESGIRGRLTEIGLGETAAWPPASLDPAVAAAVVEGGRQGLAEIAEYLSRVTTSVGLFGSPKEMAGHYLQRAAGAMGGIYGNSPGETVYPSYIVDVDGKPYDGACHDYRLRFEPGKLPPVDAFWSVTMYDAVTRFLVRNPIDRYLINSTMLDELVRDPDGGITLQLQNKPPEPAREPNWLPAPAGPFSVVMRLYLPRPEVVSGDWVAPAITRAA